MECWLVVTMDIGAACARLDADAMPNLRFYQIGLFGDSTFLHTSEGAVYLALTGLRVESLVEFIES